MEWLKRQEAAPDRASLAAVISVPILIFEAGFRLSRAGGENPAKTLIAT